MGLSLVNASNGSGEAVKANVTAARSIGSTTIAVDSLTNWPTNFIATTGTLASTGMLNPSTTTVFSGHITGTSISIDSFAPGYTDKGSSVGDIVVIKPATFWANNLATTLGTAHNDDGSLKANSVNTAAIAATSVKASNIDFTTLPFNYSTSEISTGSTWIDGKTIYKKTVNFGALPNATTKTVAHGITITGIIMNIEAILVDATNKTYLQASYLTSSFAPSIRFLVDATNITFQTADSRTTFVGYVTLYYTK